MRNFFTFLALMFSLSAFSQNSNLIIFNNSGQQFFVVLNGIKQNSMPKTNVKVEGLSPTAYKVKIIFADGKTGDIDKNLYLESNMEYSAQVLIKSPKKRSLRLFNMVELNTSPYGNGAETVIYRPNENAVYTDQSTFQSGNTQNNQGSMNTNVSGQTSGNMNSTNQNGTFQTTVNGVPQGNVNITGTTTTNHSGNVNADGTYQVGSVQTTVNGVPQGNVNITGTTTINQAGNVNADGTYQVGSVQTTVNGLPQGNVNVTTNGTQTQTTTQGGNIQMNIGLNGIGFNANVNMSGVDPNVSIDMNGMGIPTNVNQTSSTTSTTSNGIQTTTTTVNGQTTQVTTNVSGNGQTPTFGMNGQIQVTGNGMDIQTQNNGGYTQSTSTTVNGQTQTYGTNGQVQMSGNGINGQTQLTTHTHADGSIHDQNHQIVHTPNTFNTQVNNTNGQMVQNPDGTMGCFGAVSDVDYIIAGVEEASFSEDQMNFVKGELKTKCINSDQAYRIVNAFTFDGDKISMAKLCYDHLVDKQNAKKLLDLFSFSSSKEELKKYFNIK
jgi:hypothetical protein